MKHITTDQIPLLKRTTVMPEFMKNGDRIVTYGQPDNEYDQFVGCDPHTQHCAMFVVVAQDGTLQRRFATSVWSLACSTT